MKFLIYGAGVIGSVFAHKLDQAGHDVTVLARGKRYAEISQQGIIVQKVNSKKKCISKVKVIQKIEPEDYYDYIMIVMQKTQVDSILQNVAANCSKNIVFVVNNALGYEKWASIIGGERLMIGFPSAGGERRNGVVSYFIGHGMARLFQTTTFGEYNQTKSARVEQLIKVFNQSGIPSVFCKNMDIWQKYHVGIVTAIGNALYKHNGDNYKLARSSEDIKLMLQGIKEAFLVLDALGYPVTPNKLSYFNLPSFLLMIVFKPFMGTAIAETTMSKHVKVAVAEMKCLQDEFDSLIKQSGINTPAIDELREGLYSLSENL